MYSTLFYHPCSKICVAYGAPDYYDSVLAKLTSARESPKSFFTCARAFSPPVSPRAFGTPKVLCTWRMAGKADTIGKPAGELSFRVEPLEDVHPIGYVCLAVEAFQHLLTTGQEIALSPVRARL